MASLKCNECGHKISATVRKCPHCGALSDNIRTAAAGLETLLTLGDIIQDEGDNTGTAKEDKEVN